MYSNNINIRNINKRRRSTGILSESIINNEMKVIDRIIKNHKTIEERTDLDIRNSRTNSFTMLYEICNAINKFNMDEHKKFIVAIGEVSFLFDYNNIYYEQSELINDISDYFIISNEQNEDLEYIIKNMSSSLKILIEEVDSIDNYDVYLLKESEHLADSNDVKVLIDRYKKDKDKSDSKLKNIIIKLYTKTPEEIIDEVPSILKIIRYFAIIGTVAINPFLGLITFMVDQWLKIDVNRTQMEKIYKIFKKEQDKVSDKALFSDGSNKKEKDLKAYSKCLDNCMEKIESFRDSLYTDDELERRENLEESVNKLIFADELIPVNYKYQTEFSCLLEKFQLLITKFSLSSNTIFTADDVSYIDKFMKLNNLDDLKFYYTQSSRLKLSLGIIEFNEDRSELVSRICELITSYTTNFICLYDKSDNNKYKIYLISKFRIEFDTEDEDNYYKDNSVLYDDIEEMVNILNISEKIFKIEESNLMDINNQIKQNMSIIETTSPMTMSSIVVDSCGLIDIEDYSNLLIESKNNNKNPIIRTELSCAIGILDDIHEFSKLDILDCLDLQLEAGNIIKDVIHEKINLASLKVASINLVNKTKELGNKEKEISRKFDVTLSMFRNKIEKALTTDKRESIIKGSIIPSASKCIKLALLTGAAFLVNPVLAIIGSMGALAISKGCTKKERQILLDEIEIELKAVNKEVSIAESDGNMKKYRQLLLYKNKLEREAQKIRYNIKVTGQHISEREEEGDD